MNPTLTDLANRINAHLRRFERRESKRIAGLPYDERMEAPRDYFHAGACRSVDYVLVQYISDQGSSTIDRREALHYLAWLDAGNEGRHYEAFRASPPPEPEREETRYKVLVRANFGGFTLMAVTKRTTTRVYGRWLAGSRAIPSYVDRSAVIKYRATEEDLRAVLDAEKMMEAEIGAARDRFAAVLDALRNEPEPED